MARGTTAEERREATVTVIPAGENDYNPEDDLGNSFEGWRAATEEAAVPGKISAWQIPMDNHGVPQPTAKNQIRLGAWPIDAYKFDDLCAMLVKDFMTPEKILCVRLIGSRTGERGNQFNRVVILRAPEGPANGASPGNNESLSGLMKTIQESNERTLALIQRMQPAPVQSDPNAELGRILQLSALINKPMQDLMTLLLPALIGRPAPAERDPLAGLSGVVDLAAKLSDLKGGGGGEGGEGGPDWLQALKAVVPIAKPALEAIVASRAAPVAGPMPPQLAPPPAARGAPPPGAPRVDSSQPTQPSSAPEARPPQGVSMGDIPSGDIEVFAQLKPQIDSLVQIAKDGGDPVGAANLLFEEMILPLPDDFYDKLGDMFSRDNLVNQLAVFHPAVLQYRDFFEKFRKQVDSRFEAEDAAVGDRPTIVGGTG
jgi:hypothetical protein